jgi:group I intron endonuclease
VKTTRLRHRAAAIYVISNEVTGAKYYGSALRVGVRRQRHLYDLRAGSHMNPHLQAAWNKYGAIAFTFSVLAYLEKDQLRSTEQRLLDIHYGQDYCYNLSRDASAPMTGRNHSAATKQRLSAHSKGVPKSAEHREKIGNAIRRREQAWTPGAQEKAWETNRGRKQTAEHVEKKAAALRGRKQTAERVEQRVSQLRGRAMSPHVVEANRQRALKQFATPEARQRHSDACKGRVNSPEARAKMSASHRGVPWSAKRRLAS